MTAAEQSANLRNERIPSEAEGEWPERHWRRFAMSGVCGWTIPTEYGGLGFSVADVLAGCIDLARVDLVSTFVLSQFQSACSRFVASANESLKVRWLPALADGEAFSTVGISHLTTSRQHSATPSVLAEETETGWRVSGEIPWVTSGARANVLVAGAALRDGRQILFAVPTDRAGVEVADHWSLLALTGSSTGPVRLHDVSIAREELLLGPIEKVLQQGSPGGAGSLTTSALALGHAWNCIDQMAVEAQFRPALEEIVEAFAEDAEVLRTDLLAASVGEAGPEHTAETLRTRATSLALASSQALMTTSKGAGFVTGHPAERLAREAMFFLVWSCPQAVSSRLLREFSQCEIMD